MSGLGSDLLLCNVAACTNIRPKHLTYSLLANSRSLQLLCCRKTMHCSMHKVISAGRPEKCHARSLIFEQGRGRLCCGSPLRAHLLCLGRVHLAAWCPH